MLPIPIEEGLKIIGFDTSYRCGHGEITSTITDFLSKGKKYIGTITFKRHPTDEIPTIIVTKGHKPVLFPEGGVYLKGNPIPHIVTPQRIITVSQTYWIYEIYFL